jgi:hypothetical protein
MPNFEHVTCNVPVVTPMMPAISSPQKLRFYG